MESPRITPSRWYYVLAGVVFVGGCVLIAWLISKRISETEAGFQRVVAPGETDLSLREPGHYTIFYEYHSAIGDKVYSTDESISAFVCVLASKAKNSKVPLLPTTINSTYVYGAKAGRSIFDFKIDRPGVYALSSGYGQDRQGPEVVLAVGKDFAPGIFATVYEAGAVGFGSSGIAGAIALITLIKRSKKKRLLASQARV